MSVYVLLLHLYFYRSLGCLFNIFPSNIKVNKHSSSALQALYMGYRTPHKWPVKWKLLSCVDIIMAGSVGLGTSGYLERSIFHNESNTAY